MGKGKGKKGKRRGGKRKSKRGHSAPKHSLAIEGGALVSGYKIVTDKVATGASPIDAAKASNRLDVKLQDVGMRLGKNALAWDNSKWVLYGMGLHWAKNKPFAKIILKPAEKLVKMVAGKRYGL